MQKLDKQQENYIKSWQDFIDTLTEDIVIIDKRYKVIMANLAAREHFGFNELQCGQLSCQRFFSSICDNCDDCPVKKAIAQTNATLARKSSSPEVIYELHSRLFNPHVFEEHWVICTGKQIIQKSDANQKKKINNAISPLKNPDVDGTAYFENLRLHNYLYIIAEHLAQSSSPAEAYQKIVYSITEVLGVNLCGFLHLDAANELQIEAALLNNQFYHKENRSDLYQEKAAYFVNILKNESLIHIADVRRSEMLFQPLLLDSGIYSFLAYPLKHGKRLIGVFVLGYACTYQWPDNKIDFVKIIGSIVLQNLLQQETREKLKRLNENFINIFENSSDAVFIVELNGQIIEVNHTAEVLTNYSKQELIQKNVSDISKAENSDLSQMPFEMLQSHQMIFGTDLMPRQGDPIPVETREKLIRYEDKLRIVVIARDVRHRRELNRMMVQTISETQDRERKRIAEGLHDDVGPLLSTLRIYIDLIKNEQLSAPEFDEYSDKMNDIINQAIDGVREVSRNLMPGVLNDFGLVEAIEDFCQKINKTGIVRISFDHDIKTYTLEDKIKNIIYSVIKELINNSIKHANASEINIIMETVNTNLKVIFKDNGQGLNIEKQLDYNNKGLGIKNLMSKINSVAGKVNIIAEKGFGIEFFIPYIKKEKKNSLN